MTHAEAVATIVADRESHFDPAIIDAFVQIEAKFQRIRFACAEPNHADAVAEPVPRPAGAV